MNISDMLGQSGILTLFGMGIVFGFLIVMVIVISIAGKAIHAMGLDKDVQPAAGSAKPAGNNDAVTAAIGAAVNQYKKQVYDIKTS